MVIATANSIYKIDTVAKTWERVSTTNSGEKDRLRTTSGTYVSIEGVEVGHSMAIICPPIVEGADFRLLLTSRIISIDYAKEDKPYQNEAFKEWLDKEANA